MGRERGMKEDRKEPDTDAGMCLPQESAAAASHSLRRCAGKNI